MPARESYAVEFTFLDPARLAMTGYSAESMIYIVTGLVRGTWADFDDLNLKMQTTLLNHNLIELGHKLPHRRRLEKAATEPGVLSCYYCSRCGRKFEPGYKCRLCNITFQLRSNDIVVGGFPPAPARVFAYLQQQGYRFKRRIPRA